MRRIEVQSPAGPKVYPSLMYGSVQLWLWSLPRELDHPITLGIGGIGYGTVSGGVNKVRPCSGRLLAGFAPCIERGQCHVGPILPLK